METKKSGKTKTAKPLVAVEGKGGKDDKDALTRQNKGAGEVKTAAKTVATGVQMPSENATDILPVPLVSFSEDDNAQPLVLFESDPIPLVEIAEESVMSAPKGENIISHPLVLVDGEGRTEPQMHGGMPAVPNGISIMDGAMQIISCGVVLM